MKYRMTLLAALITSWAAGFAQLNVELVSHLDYQQTVNDIWGYVSPDTTEYALVGTNTGLSIVTLANPAEPEEVAFVPGENTTWRDIKTYQEFAYVVSDNTSEGILIVDLQYLPDSVNYLYFTDTLGFDNIRESHNIYIDEYGLAYLAGSNLGSIAILDVKEDPWAPKFLGQTPAPYAHDVYVRDSVVYASEIYAGRLSAYDISDLDNIQQLGSVQTPLEFTHNAWLSDDSKTVYTTDERSNAWVGAYDITDFTNIVELDRYRPAKTLGNGVIPHNVHVLNDFLVISYYTDGCIIVDAARPNNLIEVGNYDTYPGADGGFSGSWGAYPFLPSGVVLISDRQTGLYVGSPAYKRACYLEGTVYAQRSVPHMDTVPLLNAEVAIMDEDEVITPEFSGIDGVYRTGKAISGDYLVRVTHPEYETQEVMASFENGVLTELDVYLVQKRRVTISGRVMRSDNSAAVPNANILLTDGDIDFVTVSDAQGNYTFEDIFTGSYRVFAGTWGAYGIFDIELQDNLTDDLFITRGYYDDFYFDNGWTVDTANEQSAWVRDVPVSQLLFGVFECNPPVDIEGDFGNLAYVIGNMGTEPQNDDVDQGTTTLSSPLMDLTFMEDPVVSYRPWLCVRFMETEVFHVLASNGSDTLTIDTVSIDGFEGYWRDAVEIHLQDKIAITDSMQIHFRASDEFGSGNVVKTGVDAFLVFDALSSSSEDLSVAAAGFSIYPNPAQGVVNISLEADQPTPDEFAVYDIYGRIIQKIEWNEGQSLMTLATNWTAGVYVVQLIHDGKARAAQRVIVQ